MGIVLGGYIAFGAVIKQRLCHGLRQSNFNTDFPERAANVVDIELDPAAIRDSLYRFERVIHGLAWVVR